MNEELKELTKLCNEEIIKIKEKVLGLGSGFYWGKFRGKGYSPLALAKAQLGGGVRKNLPWNKDIRPTYKKPAWKRARQYRVGHIPLINAKTIAPEK